MAKQCVRYLNGTISTGITFSGSDSEIMIGYCDADHGMGEDRNSISGCGFIMNDGAIAWQAQKQGTVAISSTESVRVYRGNPSGLRKFLWITQLLKELGRMEYAPRVLLSDNQGAIALAANSQYHMRTKHVDIQLHFVRECVNSGRIQLECCPMDDMIADIMTKPSARDRHLRLMGMMGMGSATASPSEVNYPIRKVEHDKDKNSDTKNLELEWVT